GTAEDAQRRRVLLTRGHPRLRARIRRSRAGRLLGDLRRGRRDRPAHGRRQACALRARRRRRRPVPEPDGRRHAAVPRVVPEGDARIRRVMAPSFQTLITAEELRALLAGATPPVVVDTSFDLVDTDSGERRHRESHLPGAHYLHLDRDLSAPKNGRNGRHPLPDRAAFARTVGALGIGPTTQVVAYD